MVKRTKVLQSPAGEKTKVRGCSSQPAALPSEGAPQMECALDSDSLTRESNTMPDVRRAVRPRVRERLRRSSVLTAREPNWLLDGASLYRAKRLMREPRAWSRRTLPESRPAGRSATPTHSPSPEASAASLGRGKKPRT